MLKIKERLKNRTELDEQHFFIVQLPDPSSHTNHQGKEDTPCRAYFCGVSFWYLPVVFHESSKWMTFCLWQSCLCLKFTPWWYILDLFYTMNDSCRLLGAGGACNPWHGLRIRTLILLYNTMQQGRINSHLEYFYIGSFQ